jgi:hypothetical protein
MDDVDLGKRRNARRSGNVKNASRICTAHRRGSISPIP